MELKKRRSYRPGNASHSIAILAMLALGILLAARTPVVRAAGVRGFDGHNDSDQGGEGARDDDRGAYNIGLWGDLPYSDAQAQTGVPNIIADMNSQELAFTVHDGDLKAGNATKGSITPTDCSDALYAQALNYFNSLDAPAIFTTGDNDWTDCDRASNGGFSSRERLDYERQIFFSTPYTLGKRRFKQEEQTAPLCLNHSNALAACVENRRWTLHGVTYAVLNIQGSCNNLCDTNPDPAEFAARNAADIEWMHETFAEAKSRHSVAVMFISQADPGFDSTDGTRGPVRNPNTLSEVDFLPFSDPVYPSAPGPVTITGPIVFLGGQPGVSFMAAPPLIKTPDGFQSFLLALRGEVTAFGKPVAYVHGDSHYFRVDKPFLDSKGQRIANFTRVETFGDNQGTGVDDCNWLKVNVDPSSREVFSYQPQIVPANQSLITLVP